jgi:hypothetical protein
MRSRQALALVCVGLGTSLAPAAKAASSYTTHDYERCSLVSKDDAFQDYACQGYAGIPLKYHSEEDGSAVEFGSEGGLDHTPLGEGFLFAGKTMEWRGEPNALPYAAILRYDVGPAIGGPFHPELMILRLEGKRRSCHAATVDAGEPDANARARLLADRYVATFHCRRDKPRPME